MIAYAGRASVKTAELFSVYRADGELPAAGMANVAGLAERTQVRGEVGRLTFRGVAPAAG